VLFCLAEAGLDDRVEPFLVVRQLIAVTSGRRLAVVGLQFAVVDVSMAKTCSEDALVHGPKRVMECRYFSLDFKL